MTPYLKGLITQLTKIKQKINDYQEKCPHKDVTIKNCGDTGNYDPSENRYWKEFKCPDCDKFWQEDY